MTHPLPQRVRRNGDTFLIHRMGENLYAYQSAGEVSLVDRKTLISLLAKFLNQGDGNGSS